MKNLRVYLVLFFLVLGRAGAMVPRSLVEIPGTNTRFVVEDLDRFLQSDSPRVAVALGGGGARALTNIGVLKALEEEKIPVDIVVGTSMGALVAIWYGSGLSIADMELAAAQMDYGQFFYINFPFHRSLLNSDLVDHAFEALAPVKYLEDFPIDTGVLSYDLLGGTKYVQTTGRIIHAIRGPYAIPALFSGIYTQDGEHYLVDAGIQELTPSQTAHILGADLVIATTAFDDFPYTTYESPIRGWSRLIALIKDTFSQPIIDAYSHVVIDLNVGDYSFMDFQLAEHFIDLGYRITMEQMPQIKSALEAHGIPYREPGPKGQVPQFERVLQDLNNQRLPLATTQARVLFNIGQETSFSAPRLFPLTNWNPQYGLAVSRGHWSAAVRAQGALESPEMSLRYRRLTPALDLQAVLWDRGADWHMGLIYWPQNGSVELGFTWLDQTPYLDLREQGGLGLSGLDWSWENRLLLSLEQWRQSQGYTSHLVSAPLSSRWSINTRLLLSRGRSLQTPSIYRGGADPQSMQLGVDLVYHQRFPYSKELLQFMQMTGVDYYTFWDWQPGGQALGTGISLDLAFLGMKKTGLGGLAFYDLSQRQGGLRVNLDFSF